MHYLWYLRVIEKKAQQHFVNLGCILYLDKKTQCLKFGLILAGLNFKPSSEEQGPGVHVLLNGHNKENNSHHK